MVKNLIGKTKEATDEADRVKWKDPMFLRKVVRRFKKRTSKGLDDVHMCDVREATDESLAHLGEILRGAYESVSLPLQALMVIMSLRGKKAEGESRTIANASAFYRILMGATRQTRDGWEASKAEDTGDTSAKGKRVEDEVAKRMMSMEFARTDGDHVVVSMWDAKQFFDRMPVDSTIKEAEADGYPQRMLALSMIEHRAPRILTHKGIYGKFIGICGRSILPGCPFAPALGRIKMANVDRRANAKHKHRYTKCHRHIDDATQTTIMSDAGHVIREATRAGTEFVRAMKEKGIEMSSKSVIMASSNQIAKKVVEELHAEGIVVKMANSCDDLGVQTNDSGRRRNATLTKRVDKGKNRCSRLNKAAQVNTKARILMKTGARPQMEFGAVCCGVAPSQLDHMRRNYIEGLGNMGYKPCGTASIAWSMGMEADPWVSIPTKQTALYVRIWEAAPHGTRRRMAKEWQMAHDLAESAQLKWQDIIGPVWATVAYLRLAGWDTSDARKWKSTKGRTYNIEEIDDHTKRDIITDLEEDLKDTAWIRASKHAHGSGLEKGTPCMTGARRAQKWFERKNRPAEAIAVDMAVAGGIWCTEKGEAAKCECGEEDTPEHRYYSCKLLWQEEEGEEDLRKLRWIVTERNKWSSEARDKSMCLWYRGLIPADWGSGMPDCRANDIIMKHTSNLHEVANESGRIYTDGSGGPRWCPIKTARCGAGIATFTVLKEHDEQGHDRICFTKVALMATGVGGRQTVPNAEAWAIKNALPLGTERNITVLLDAAYVVKGMAADEHVRRRMRQSGNGRTWEETYINADKRNGDYKIERTPAHVTADKLVEGDHNIFDFIGNTLADALAGVGATNEIGRSLEPQNMEKVTAIAEGVIKRIAIIEARRWSRGRKQHYEPADLPIHETMVMDRRTRLMERRVELMGHKLTSDGNWYKCTECRRKCKKDNYDNWVNNKCALNDSPPDENHGRVTHVRGDIGNNSDRTCSLRKRKRIIGKQKEILEERRKQEIGATKEAWARANYAISWTLWGRMASGRNHPPIQAHRTHVLISCGGFGGCIRCGSVAGYCKNRRLEKECRGSCPTGSRGPIRRLSMGRHPHPQRGQGLTWVDGSLSPKPTRWETDQRVWTEAADDEAESINAEFGAMTPSGLDDHTDRQFMQRETSGANTCCNDRVGSRADGDPACEGEQPECRGASVDAAVREQHRVAKRARFRF